MEKTTKRFLSLLIAVVMVVSMIPVSAIAAETTVGTAAELAEALSDA